MGKTRKGFSPRAKQGLVSLLLAVTMSVGVNLATAAPAEAVSVNCGWPRCTIYLNKEETRRAAYDMSIPPAIWPTVWGGLAYGLVLGHRWFMIQYANRGMCTQLNLSAAPWETQGLRAYYC
jgi:hypothetical protein